MTKFSLGSIGFKAFALAFLLSVFNVSVFAQNSSVSETQTEQSALSQSSQNPVESTNAEAQNWNWSSGTYEQQAQPASTFGLFVRMVLALAFVLVLAYVAVRFLKRSTKLSDSDDPFLRHVSHLSLSASRSVDIVTILDHAYILGVSDNAVNLIGQIDDAELVNSMNLYADKNDNKKRPRSFDDILSIFMPNSRQTQNQNIYGSSARNVAESLQRQRNRLNEEE